MTDRLPYPPPWMDMVTLCQHVCVTPNTVATWMECGILPQARVRGGTPMWRWVDVRDALRGNVYFVESGDFIKIGYTYSPKQRFSNLAGSSAHKIRVLLITHGTKVYEARVHKQFAHLRDHGEWFRREPDLLAYIATLRGAT